MNKIDLQLEKIRASDKIGLMTHVVVGYPSIQKTKELIIALEKGGSDFIELQIPFSDPIADGPTIMKASDLALKNGTTVIDAMTVMKEVSSQVEIPLLFMCYFNTVFHYGVEKFCHDAAESGASGLIVPDVPPEEEQYEHLIQSAKKYDLILVRVISPASSQDRLKKNAASAEGLVYCVSKFGITGTSTDLDRRLTTYLENVSHIFNIPKAVGFGISKPEQVKALKGHAEIAVVGSAIVERVMKQTGNDFAEIEKFVSSLKSS